MTPAKIFWPGSIESISHLFQVALEKKITSNKLMIQLAHAL